MPVMPFLESEVEMPIAFCSGCGTRFQTKDPQTPGFLPPAVIESRAANEQGVSKTRDPLCQRCHSLRFHNTLPSDNLRVSEENSELLKPAHFVSLLGEISRKRCVVVAIVDVFDFHGSLVPDLPKIVGSDNPIILVANKVDLLPPETQLPNVERWIRKECRQAGLESIHSLHMVSCTKGAGMPQLLRKLEELMSYKRMDAYVVGAANAGKSSFINRVLRHSKAKGDKFKGDASPRAGKAATEALTTSHLPGTTLGFVRVSVLAGRQALFDTPGLILPNQLTTLLSPDELANVVPKKRGEHITLQIKEGKAILVGGLAQIHMRSGLPFLLTFYLANSVSVHPTRSEKVGEVLEKHLGGLLSPPSSMEELMALGKFEEQVFEVEGRGWNEAAVDLVLPGLGWVAVTGSGSCTISVELPGGIQAISREPLIEGNTRKTMAKFTGSKIRDGRGNTKRRR